MRLMSADSSSQPSSSPMAISATRHVGRPRSPRSQSDRSATRGGVAPRWRSRSTTATPTTATAAISRTATTARATGLSAARSRDTGSAPGR